MTHEFYDVQTSLSPQDNISSAILKFLIWNDKNREIRYFSLQEICTLQTKQKKRKIRNIKKNKKRERETDEERVI